MKLGYVIKIKERKKDNENVETECGTSFIDDLYGVFYGSRGTFDEWVPSIISLPTTAVEVQAHSSHHKTKYVYVTPTGRKYHTHKCGRGTYRKAKLSYAKSRGLTPCKKCY